MKMRRFKRLGLVGLLALLLIFALTACSDKDGDYVAKVDGEGITVEEFKDVYENFKTDYQNQFGEDILDRELEEGLTMKDYIIDASINRLVMEKIITNDAKKRNISVNKEEVDQALEEYIESIGGKENFENSLKDLGATKDEFRKDIELLKLMEKHKEAVKEGAKIKEADAKKYFKKNKEALEMVRASHIVIEKEDREKAEKIKKRLDDGEDFESLAKEESQDFQSALAGGDLGYFQRGTRGQEFEEVAFSMEPGEISDIVESDVALHIIKLIDKKDTFEDLKEDIEEELKETAYMDEIHALVGKSSIEIFKEKIEELEASEEVKDNDDEKENDTEKEDKKD